MKCADLGVGAVPWLSFHFTAASPLQGCGGVPMVPTLSLLLADTGVELGAVVRLHGRC